MRVIDQDVAQCKTPLDFCDALTAALGKPYGYGSSIDGLLDLMLWDEREELEPPYSVRLFGISKVPQAVRDYISSLQRYLAEACEEYRIEHG